MILQIRTHARQMSNGGRGDYEGMEFLIDRGIDMAIKDYRWAGTAAGWAYHANKDLKMVQWLAAAERERGSDKRVDESHHRVDTSGPFR